MTVWMDSEWDERAQTAYRRGVRADVFPNEYEPGTWSWTVKATVDISERPTQYDRGTADSVDEALDAAEASLAAAVAFYNKETP